MLVVLVFLVSGFLATDRIAAHTAENQIARHLKDELAAWHITTASTPKVSTDGFPFLVQMVDGRYKRVTIAVDRPKIGGAQFDSLRIVASSVRAGSRAIFTGGGKVIAGKVTGTVTIGWDAVRPLLEVAGMPPGVDPVKLQLTVNRHQLQLRVPVNYAGLSFALVVRASLIVDGTDVRVELDEVGTDSGSPRIVQDLIKRYRDRLSISINIPAMPYDLVLEKVEISTSHLLLTTTASDVELSGAGT